MTGIERAAIDAWQAWLALEHEAVWLYGVIGGRVDGVTAEARLAWNRHRDTRDRLTGLILAAGAEPLGPQLGYHRGVIDGAEDAQAAAQAIEASIAAAAMGCIEDESLRPEVVAALRASAQAAAEWGAVPSAFPGLPVRPAD